MRFCPKCGKKGIKGDFCLSCQKEMNPLVKIPKDLSIKVCRESKTFLLKNKWTKYEELEDIVKKVLRKYFPEKTTIITPIIENIYTNPGIKATIEVEIEKSPTEIYAFPVILEFTISPKLSKKGSQYFEGILQLRNPKEEIIVFIRSEAKKEEKKGVHINKEAWVRNGVDFYCTSQKYIQKLGEKLYNNYGGTLKVSSKLFSVDKQTSKELYRVNVLYKAPDFIKGNVILIKDDKMEKIIRVTKTGKQVVGTDLTTGKKTMAEYKRKEIVVLPRIKTTVAKAYPEVEILNPETFQPVPIQNKVLKKEVKQGHNVKVVCSNDLWWIA